MASPKILIVDDSKTIRMQIRDMLSNVAFTVIEAKDGAEGLMLIVQERPNLILLDFFMPRMNGWEVLQKIQADPALKLIPVVVMSGRREDVEQTVPELFNYFEFISKPFQQAALFKAIQTASAKAKERQTALTADPTAAAVVVPSVTSSAPSTAAVANTTATSGAAGPEMHSSLPVVIDDVQQLKAEVRQLREQNANLHTEVETLKHRMQQLAAFVRQRM